MMESTAEAMKVLVLLVLNGVSPVNVAVVPDVETCRQVAEATRTANPGVNFEVVCVPLPKGAAVSETR